jgi:hypothetical protein
VERSEWSDDDAVDAGAYPPAPVPAHERTWRHPSEVGTKEWVHTEPPLTIGRGLLITTGAIGGLLSLAILWAMLPSAGRGSSSAPSVLNSIDNNRPIATLALRFDTFAPVADQAIATTTTVRRAATVVDDAQQSATTLAARPQPTTAPPLTDVYEVPPMALSINGSLVITTARAAGGHASITVTGSDGQPHTLDVGFVDRDAGVALLAAQPGDGSTTFTLGQAVAVGDVVTILGQHPMTATVITNAEGQLTLDGWNAGLAEGTPVVNSNGQLVAMCSHGSTGTELVSVAGVGTILPPSKPAQPPAASPGLHIADANTPTTLTVDAVDANGPAALGGIVVGDIITAIDSAALTSSDQWKAAIAAHAPGDVVTLTVVHADQTTANMTLTLA